MGTFPVFPRAALKVAATAKRAESHISKCDVFLDADIAEIRQYKHVYTKLIWRLNYEDQIIVHIISKQK